ncbi:MAG: hypothetical protein HRT52_12890 [Colwellia sp.]|nr:hypothetical protein [Colwellia sp.]
MSVEKEPTFVVGGSIEKALKGEYAIDVSSVLKEAWQYTLQSRIAINLGLLISLFIGMTVVLLASSFMGGIEHVVKDPQSSSLMNILVTLAISPFLAGVEMMGVFHAIHVSTHTKLIFAFLKRGSWVAVCAILSSMLITLGLTLLYIPGIYLLVALSLTIPLVVEKQMSPLKAIVLCIKATRFQWFKLLSIYSILMLILTLSVTPLIILILMKSSFSFIGIVLFLFSITYLAPLFYNVKGILYREIFGLKLHNKEALAAQESDSFSA